MSVFNYIDFVEDYVKGLKQLLLRLAQLNESHLINLKELLSSLEIAAKEAATVPFTNKIDRLKDAISHLELQVNSVGDNVSAIEAIVVKELNYR